jgi:hypothetical protein
VAKVEDFIKYDDGFDHLADLLSNTKGSINLTTFDNFVQDVFSKSYPDYSFNTWHIRLISSWIDEILSSKNRLAIAALPRYHLKSTLCGYALSIFRMLQSFGDGLYVSYKEELAQFHLSNLKQAITRNELLSSIFKDQKTQSDSMINYKIGDRKIVRMFSSGIFSMKRGIHTDSCVVVDDILGTVDNPLVLTDLEKAERMFNQEIMNIPNPGCPLIVFGTAIDYSDLLFKLRDNAEFGHLWLPAISPLAAEKDEYRKIYGNPDVLWETRFNRSWLDGRKAQAGWKSFASEFLLMPVLSAEAFFTRNDLDPCIDKALKNYSIYQGYDKEWHHVVAGLDIGKRRHPSHLSVFVDDKNDNLLQIHQEFWDGVEYTEQVDRIKTAISNFGIDKMYIDCTRGEMEERGLPRECVMIKFTGKGQRSQASFANDFAKRVENHKVKLIDDDRFLSQILCVSNDLKAPQTVGGHGDSFWSVALALGAYQDYYASDRGRAFSYMGNLQEQFIDHAPAEIRSESSTCPVCHKRLLVDTDNGQRCDNCFSFFEGGVKNVRSQIV